MCRWYMLSVVLICFKVFILQGSRVSPSCVFSTVGGSHVYDRVLDLRDDDRKIRKIFL